eukprot:jgi/Hompol1/3649/HPOL_000281-RA
MLPFKETTTDGLFVDKDPSKRAQAFKMVQLLHPNASSNMLGLHIDTSPLVGKQYFVISSRVHPAETIASHMLDGLIDFILSHDPRAILLRSLFVFKIIPMLNPDGVFHGHYRGDLRGTNLNRVYVDPDPVMYPTIYTTKRYLEHHLQKTGPIKWYFDFHGHANKYGCFLFGNWIQGDVAKQIEMLAFARCMMLNCELFDFNECDFTSSRDLVERIGSHAANPGESGDSGGGGMNGPNSNPKDLVTGLKIDDGDDESQCAEDTNDGAESVTSAAAKDTATSYLQTTIMNSNTQQGKPRPMEPGNIPSASERRTLLLESSKEGTGRFAMHRALGIHHCYTFEANYYGCKMDRRPIVKHALDLYPSTQSISTVQKQSANTKSSARLQAALSTSSTGIAAAAASAAASAVSNNNNSSGTDSITNAKRMAIPRAPTLDDRRFTLQDMHSMGKSLAVSVLDMEIPRHTGSRIPIADPQGMIGVENWAIDRVRRMYKKVGAPVNESQISQFIKRREIQAPRL